MKENVLIQMKNKMDKLDQGFGIVYHELMAISERVHQLGAILSNIEGYKEAVEKLAKQVKEESEKAKSEKVSSKSDAAVDSDAQEQKEVQSEEETSGSGLDLDLD